jgi:hypothetical protein
MFVFDLAYIDFIPKAQFVMSFKIEGTAGGD